MTKDRIEQTHKKFYVANNSLNELNDMLVYKNFEYHPSIGINGDMDLY